MDTDGIMRVSGPIFVRMSILLGTAGTALSVASASIPASTPDERLPKVVTVHVVAREISRDLLFPARVASQVQTEVFADFDGVVTTLKRNVGDRLARNDTILVLRNTDPVYSYAPVRVYTPVAGVLGSLTVTEGTQVKRGQSLATLTDPKKLRIEIEVPAMDLDFVRAKITGTFESSALVTPVKVVVTGVSPSINSDTGTAPAIVSFDCPVSKDPAVTPGCGVRPGLLGQVRLVTDRHTGIRLPSAAINYRDGNPIVRIVRDGIASVRAVKLGEKAQDEVEVVEGLRSSDEVILRSSASVRDGQRIQVERGEGDAAPGPAADAYGPPAPAPAAAART